MNSRDGIREKKSFSPQKIRRELILYLLQNYGDLQTKEIAKVLGHDERTIRRSLRKLKDLGKVESDKLGRGYIWSSSEKGERGSIYF